MTALSASQKSALHWLAARGGDAGFDRNGVALAQGDSAPVYRSTWNRLAAANLAEFYGGKRDGGTGFGRVRLTESGRQEAAKLDPARKGYTYAKQPPRPLMVDDDPAEFRA